MPPVRFSVPLAPCRCWRVLVQYNTPTVIQPTLRFASALARRSSESSVLLARFMPESAALSSRAWTSDLPFWGEPGVLMSISQLAT